MKLEINVCAPEDEQQGKRVEKVLVAAGVCDFFFLFLSLFFLLLPSSYLLPLSSFLPPLLPFSTTTRGCPHHSLSSSRRSVPASVSSPLPRPIMALMLTFFPSQDTVRAGAKIALLRKT